MASMLFLALVLSLVIHVFADVYDTNAHLVARQAQCNTPCSWLAGLESCSTTDLTCACGVFESAGSAVASCESCLQPVNATVAADISELAQSCQAMAPAPAPAPVPAPAPSPSPTSSASPTPSGDCVTVCAWTDGLQPCTDLSCICGVISAAGSEVASCGSCLQTLNATLANELSQAEQACGQLVATSSAAPVTSASQHSATSPPMSTSVKVTTSHPVQTQSVSGATDLLGDAFGVRYVYCMLFAMAAGFYVLV